MAPPSTLQKKRKHRLRWILANGTHRDIQRGAILQEIWGRVGRVEWRDASAK